MRAKNISGVALLDEVWKITDVINVRVAQDGDVHLRGVEGKILVPVVRLGAAALIEPALEQDASVVDLEQEHRAGGCAGGTKELHLHIKRILARRRRKVER